MFDYWYSPSEILSRLNGNAQNGLYAIKLKNKNAFELYNPAFHSEYVGRRQPDIIYIGKAYRRGGIRARLMNELRQHGKATFFRSAGALLKFNPVRECEDTINYTFAEPDKNAIIAFMEKNLLVSYEPYIHLSEINELEYRLIHSDYKPIINIKNNPEPSKVVQEERARCISFARGNNLSLNNDFTEIMRYAHYWNWLPDWGIVEEVYAKFPDSYSILTPFAYAYLEELIRSTTSDYGIQYYDKEGNVNRKKVGIKIIELAIAENKDKNGDLVLLLEKVKVYFTESSPLNRGDNRNSVLHGYMHSRFWDKDAFEDLVHNIGLISKHAGF